MKRMISVLLTVLAVGSGMCAYGDGAPEISAQAAILVEAQSGETIYEKNADEPMLIASTTKLLTALVALEHCDLDMEVTVEPQWAGVEGSSMYLKAGQSITVEDLLYGLMLASGNDAAVALACIAAGSEEAFAALMNEKAAALGCENAHFVNPNGLDHPDHHASARDLAVIARAAAENETLCRIMAAPSRTVGELTYTNHNRLLRECEGVFGGKTGYTMSAGRTLVSFCEREGVTLVCVTLAAPDDWNDHKALYDWGYEGWTSVTAAKISDEWSVPVVGGTEEAVSVSPEEELSVSCRESAEISVTVELPAFVYAPVETGETAGVVTVWKDGLPTESVPLRYNGSVNEYR